MFTNLPLNNVQLLDHDFLPRRNLVKKYLYEFNEDRLMHTFLINAGLGSQAEPLGGWEAPDCGLRGHFTGHFLSACAKFAFADEDTLLKNKAEKIIDIMEQCSKPNGYISAFEENVLDILEQEENRNIWAPYYTLHKILQGLTDCAILLKNKKALSLAINLADYIYRRFSKLSYWKTDGILRCTKVNPANEFGGIGDTLYTLYELTKKEWILELARLFDRDYFLDKLIAGQDFLENLHANTHLPMILSAMHRYQITGKKEYRIAAENFYFYLKKRTFANGNNSSKATAFIKGEVSERAEHWGAPDHLEDALTGGESESCCAHNTEKIIQKLFEWTGSIQYLEHMECLKYNAVLNSASQKNGLSQYHQPMGNGAVKKFSEPYNSFWCCTASGIEAMSELQKNIWFSDKDSLLVQSYISSAIYWKDKGIKITQHSGYPDTLVSTLTIETEKPAEFNIILRESTVNTITINGIPFSGNKENGYLILHRIFQNQDTIEIEIHAELHLSRLQGSNNTVALMYGNILLAGLGDLRKLPGITTENLLSQIHKLSSDKITFELTDFNGRKIKLIPLYRVEDETYTVYLDLSETQKHVTDFSFAQNGKAAYD